MSHTPISHENSAAATFITGGSVVSLDPEIGVLPRGDVLIGGTDIVAVGADLAADERFAAMIASAGRILRHEYRGRATWSILTCSSSCTTGR